MKHEASAAEGSNPTTMAMGKGKKESSTDSARNRNRRQPHLSTSATRRQAKKNLFLRSEIEMPRTNAATAKRRGVWRTGKARRDGDGVTGELVLEQGRGIKRSKQHEAAVQRVSPLPSTGILCFGGRGRQQHHATTGRNALAGRHGKAASGDLVPAIPAGGRPAVGGKGKVKLCRAPIMASASQPLN